MKRSYHKLSFLTREALANQLHLSCEDSRLEPLFLTLQDSPSQETAEDHEFYQELSSLLLEEFHQAKPLIQGASLSSLKKPSKLNSTEQLKQQVLSLSNYDSSRGQFITGLKLFEMIARVTRNFPLKILIPSTIVPLKEEGLILRISVNQESIRGKIIAWADLNAEIDSIHSLQDPSSPIASIVKTFIYDDTSKNYFGKIDTLERKDIQTGYWLLHKSSMNRDISIIQQFLYMKSPSKIRIHFVKGELRAYRISLVDHSQDTIIPQIYKKWLLRKGEHFSANKISKDKAKLKEIYKVLVRSCDFFRAVAAELGQFNTMYKFFNHRYKLFQHKKANLKLNTKADVKKQNIIKLKELDKCTVTEIFSNSYLARLKKVVFELSKAVSLNYSGKRTLIELSADFIEHNNNLLLIKPHYYKLSSRRGTSLNLGKASVYNATKSSSENACCGSYCDINFNVENLEHIIKEHSEYSDLLYSLLCLKKTGKDDPLVSMYSKKPPLPLREDLQYKVLRKTIIEDQTDPDSFMKRLKNLPSSIVNRLNIKIQDHTETTPSRFKQKFFWGLERVPVCFKCYQIYKSKDKPKTDSNPKLEETKITDKLPAIREVRQSASVSKLPKRKRVVIDRIASRFGNSNINPVVDVSIADEFDPETPFNKTVLDLEKNSFGLVAAQIRIEKYSQKFDKIKNNIIAN